MANESFQVILKRLIVGNATNSDIIELYLYFREIVRINKIEDCKIVCDVSDFVAHSVNRDRGEAFQRIRDTKDMMQLQVSRLMKGNCGKAEAERGVRAALRIHLESRSKISAQALKKKSDRHLTRLISKIICLRDGFFEFSRDLSGGEMALMEDLMFAMVVEAPYGYRELLREIDVLIKTVSEDGEFNIQDIANRSKSQILLTPVARMSSGSFIRNELGEEYDLDSGIDDKGKIAVLASFPVDIKGHIVKLRVTVFESGLKADTSCDVSLPLRMPWTGFALEINDEGKLARKVCA